jgi:dual oxidase
MQRGLIFNSLLKQIIFPHAGQVVSGEILMASESGCPIEVHKIPIEKCDEMYDKECRGDKYIPFHRAGYDKNTGQSPNSPREQLNRVTSWIDGSFIYSTSEAWVNAMRSFKNGSFNTAAAELVASATNVTKEEQDVDEAHAASIELSMPPKNLARVPLFNSPAPHVLRMFDPERLYCEYRPLAKYDVF